MTCAPNITQVAFAACYQAKNLIRIDLPEGITIIGRSSFNGCISLKEIKFPKSLTSIGICSFWECSSLEKVDLLHTKVQELGKNAFSYCTRLREMKVPESLQKCAGNAFEGCSKLVLSKVFLAFISGDPTHLVHDGTEGQARWNEKQKITTMTCAPNITEVAYGACLNAKNLIRIDLPEGIAIIGMSSFSGCISLKEIKFPKSLTSIGKFSFNKCSSIEKVDLLHTNVKRLGGSAFWGCTSLREMKVPDSLQQFDDSDGGVFAKCSMLVPSDVDISDAKAVVTYLRAQVSSRPPSPPPSLFKEKKERKNKRSSHKHLPHKTRFSPSLSYQLLLLTKRNPLPLSSPIPTCRRRG